MLKDELQNAAVLVPCFEDKGETWVILTRRTDHVDHHKGQICFPGGAYDPSDASPWKTALRETEEEIGIPPDRVTFLRELSPRVTPSGFRVVPFAAELHPPLAWHINEREIAEVFTVPITHLRDPHNLRWVKRQINEWSYLDPLFTYRHYEIWGLTGRILCEYLGFPFPEGSLP